MGEGEPAYMSEEIDFSQFPNLRKLGFERTSDPTPEYNCIAFAAGIENEWWEPGMVWPDHLDPFDDSLAALVQVYGGLGYELCSDGSLEPGFEKVAIYGGEGEDAEYLHAARQQPDGTWKSKLGKGVDILHKAPEAVADGEYGAVRYFMRRRLRMN